MRTHNRGAETCKFSIHHKNIAVSTARISAGFISWVVFACSLRVLSTKTCNGLSRILPSVTKKDLVLEINAEDECKRSVQTVLDASAEQLTPPTLRRSDVGAADFLVGLYFYGSIGRNDNPTQQISFRRGRIDQNSRTPDATTDGRSRGKNVRLCPVHHAK